MAYDINCGAAYNGRNTYELHLYVRRNAVSGNSSNYAWELYAQKNSGTAWNSDASAWSININGQTWSGSANLDFRNTSRITFASGTTNWFAHDGAGNLSFTVSMSHNGGSPIGSASGACAFYADRIAQVPGAPTPIAIDTITSTSFRYRFQGTTDGGSAITQWQTALGRSSNPADPSWTIQGNRTGTDYFYNLIPGTKYYVKSRGVNAVGAGPWSGTWEVTTLGGGRIYDGANFVNSLSFIETAGANAWSPALGFINTDGANAWSPIG